MGKSIYRIRIKEGIDEDVWYSEYEDCEFYVVKVIVAGRVMWEVINKPEFKHCYVEKDDSEVMELVTRVFIGYG